ncbi:MAG: hypothetical protein R2712_19575 [Vicinamibacterales bacterium]
MPPTVAAGRRDVRGEPQSVRGRSAALSSSSTTPGWTRAVRASGSIARTRLKNLDVSTTTPAPMAWPACEVPPPRGVIGTPWRAATSTVLTTSSAVRGMTRARGSIW